MGLQSGDFDASELIAVYSPPNLRSVMPGNHVMLRSGGPDMIVADAIVDEDGDDAALCQWTDELDEFHSETFKLVCLTCYGAK